MDRTDFERFAQEVNDSLTENDRPTLGIITAEALQGKALPPIRWFVNGLVTSGLTILASPPKFGKSWMVLDGCLTVAMGGTFLGYRCERAGTLYLALEDSERRLKSRMDKILGGRKAPYNFRIATTAPTLGTGLLEALESYIAQYPDTGFVVIDTLQKVRDISGSRDVYGRDYSDVGALKKFADTHNVAVVLVHHLRKAGDDGDPFARISGTTGVTGAADTMMVLTKEKRGDETATLSVTGRDVEQMELVVAFDKSRCVWKNLGDIDAYNAQKAQHEYQESPIVVTVKKLLAQSHNGWTGTAQQLLDAGRYITRTPLADSARSLSNKLRDMGSMFFDYDQIVYQRKGNGSGGGRHSFSYVFDQSDE